MTGIRRRTPFSPEHQRDSLSPRNPANFMKDFVRNRKRANVNWPVAVWEAGYTAQQVTGQNLCFAFIPKRKHQTEPFSSPFGSPDNHTPKHRIESVSLPLASRKLGRTDEPWLIQVLVRLRVIETHLTLFSPLRFLQLDHLQMSVKLARSEIDTLFLGIIETPKGEYVEAIVSGEAKSLHDDLLENQMIRQVQAIFSVVTQDVVVPLGIKAIGPSQVYVVECQAVSRSEAPNLQTLVVVSRALYELVPSVPGIGGLNHQ